jgi:outer membrane protein assembly factor BamB
MWTYQTEGGVVSSPAVVDGKVYVGSGDSYVYALNITTTTPNGVLIWKYKTGGAVLSSPAVVDGQVFIGSDDGYLYNLDQTTGELIWKYKTGGAIRSSPAVTEDKVIFGSNDGYIYALDRFYVVNGTPYLIWKYKTDGGIQYSSPAVFDNRVFIGGNVWDDKSRAVIYCLSETTTDPKGELIWRHIDTTTNYPDIVTTPVVMDGQVFVSYSSSGGWGYTILSLNASTGSLFWTFSGGKYIYGRSISSVAVGYGKVFVSALDSILALNQTTGEMLWSYSSQGTYAVTSSPAISEDKVFVGNYYGFFCLNQTDGTVIWNYESSVRSSPAVSDGRIFVGTDDGYVLAFGNATRLTVSASPSEITLGGSTLISGKLTDAFSGDGLLGKVINLEYSTDRGATWNPINSTITSSDGSYSYIWTPTTAGRYITIRAIFKGDASYNGATSPGYFIHVYKVSSTLTVTANPSTITYGESTSIEGSLTDPDGKGIPDQTIYMEYSTDGLTYNPLASVTTISNGNYFYLWTPHAGSYTIRANFTGNDNYTGSSSTTSLIVNKASTTITTTINPLNVPCGNITIINGTLQDEHNTPLPGQTITLEYSADGGTSWNTITFITTFADGSYSYPWAPQEVGSYLIRAKFAGTVNYNPSDETTSLTVVKGSSSTTTILSATTITYGQGVTINGIVSPPTSDGTVTLQWSIDNVNWNVVASGSPSDGIYTETWTPPYIGTFYVRAIWSGNLNYNGSISSSKILTVTKVSSTIVVSLSSSTITFGQTITITGTISPTTDGTITLEYSVDGSTWLVITSELSSGGSYTSSWKPPDIGTYYIRARWDGNVNYNGATSTVKTLTVDQATTTINITVPAQITYEANITIQGTLSPALADITITVQYSFDGGNTWNDLATLTTDTTGSFSYEWAKPSAGVYQIRASWNGNARYKGTTSETAHLSVIKAASSITLILSSISTITDSSITISGKISPAIAEVTVTIYYRLEGMATYNILTTTKTDNNGNYSYTWAPKSAGTYQITAAWIGTNNYDGAQSGIQILNVLNPEQPPYSELINTIQILQTNLTKAQETIQNLETELSNAQNATQTLQQELTQVQNELAQTRADLNQAQRTIQNLQGELSRGMTIQYGFIATVIILALSIGLFTLKGKSKTG